MGDEKDAFYLVRKGDIIGVYKSFADCQAQAGFSPLDPSISIYKGYGLSKEAESYLASRGLKQARFSIGASDLQNGLFGALSVCPFQDAIGSRSLGNRLNNPVQLDNYVESQAPVGPARGVMPASTKRNQNQVADGLNSFSASPLQPVPLRAYAGSQASAESSSFFADSQKGLIELNNYASPWACKSCIIEFDGASKGNPGPAGAGAILRATDGSAVWKLWEGVGIATNNVAEYRGVILGLRIALEKGFQHVNVRGDSQLVCFQIQGKWKTKNENMANLCKEAKELAKKFVSFAIEQVPREFNSDADAQAFQATTLRDGQVKMELARPHA